MRLSDRDVGLSELEPRFSTAALISAIDGVVSSILCRDVPDELAALNDVDDFIKLLRLSNRDVGLSELEPRLSIPGLISSLEAVVSSVLR